MSLKFLYPLLTERSILRLFSVTEGTHEQTS